MLPERSLVDCFFTNGVAGSDTSPAAQSPVPLAKAAVPPTEKLSGTSPGSPPASTPPKVREPAPPELSTDPEARVDDMAGQHESLRSLASQTPKDSFQGLTSVAGAPVGLGAAKRRAL